MHSIFHDMYFAMSGLSTYYIISWLCELEDLTTCAYRLVHPTTLLLLPSTVWLWKWRDTIQIQYIRHGIHYFNPNGRLIYGKVERGWFLYEQLCFCIVTEKFNSISFSSYSKPVNSLLFWITLSSQLIISTETSHHQPLKNICC